MADATPGNPAPLDPQVVQLAQAIRHQESGGNPTIVNKLSGATGAYQYMPKTWATAAPAAGVTTPLAQATLEEQNQVAYTQIKGWKDQGYNPGQIASMWYTGSPHQVDNTTPQKGGNPSPADYVKSVFGHYQAAKGGTLPAPAAAPAGAFPATNISAPTPAPYNPLSPPPGTPEPAVPSLLAPNDVAPAPAAPEAGTTPAISTDDVYNAAEKEAEGNTPGGALGFAQNAVKGAASFIPGSPYLQAGASYITPGSGMPDGTPFAQRVAAYRGLQAGTAAAAPIATTVGGGAIMAPALAATLPNMAAGGAIKTGIQAAALGGGLAAPTAALNVATGQLGPIQAGGDVALQAGLSALGGVIAKPMLQGAAAVLRNIFPKFADGTLPTAAVQAFASRLGIKGDDLSKALTAMNAAGASGGALAGASEANLGKFATLLARNPDTAVMARQAAAQADKDIQSGAETMSAGLKSQQDYINAREAQATADYAAARAETIPLTAEEADIIRGLREDNGVTLPKPVMKQLDLDGLGISGPGQISGSAFDSVRQALSRQASQPGAAQVVRDAADALHSIGNANPLIAAANANYKTNSRLIDASALGERIMASDEPAQNFIARMADPKQYDPTVPGAASALRQSIGLQLGAKGSANPEAYIKRLATDGVLGQKLRATLGDTATGNLRTYATAQAQNDARLRAVVPSLASREADDGDLAIMHGIQGIVQATDLSPYSIYHFARALSGKLRGFSTQSQEQIGRLMFSTDPLDQAKAVSAAKAVTAYHQQVSNIAAKMGAVLGAGATQNVQGTTQ